MLINTSVGRVPAEGAVPQILDDFRVALVDRRPFEGAKIGFTGSREGPTKEQRDMWGYVCKELIGIEAHNGCAIGVDRYVALNPTKQAQKRNWTAVFWPANQDGLNWAADVGRAYVKYGLLREVRPPLERNKCIVTESHGLIAMPITIEEQVRSGTWATIRYARKMGKPVLVIGPNGDIWFDGSARGIQV